MRGEPSSTKRRLLVFFWDKKGGFGHSAGADGHLPHPHQVVGVAGEQSLGTRTEGKGHPGVPWVCPGAAPGEIPAFGMGWGPPGEFP